MGTTFLPTSVIHRAELATAGDPVMISSFGRSGTHLVIDLVRSQFAAFGGWKWPGETPAALYIPLEDFGRRRYPAARVRRTLAHARRTVVKTHHREGSLRKLQQVQPHLAAWLEERAQHIIIIRDPVVAISKVWALQNYWDRRSGARERLDPEQFFAGEAQRWADHATAAATLPRALLVRLEDLIDRPSVEIARLGHHLGETPRFAEPLLVSPHRTSLQARLARLRSRPASTHIVLPDAERQRFGMRWSASSLEFLESVAGSAMRCLGYRTRRPCIIGEDDRACAATCSSCAFSLDDCARHLSAEPGLISQPLAN